MIEFITDFEPEHGRLIDAAPGVRRMTAANGGPFTFTGTNSWVVGDGEVIIIDPGPADPVHLEALLSQLGNEKVALIALTHTHLDHSGGLEWLRKRTGAPVAAEGPHRSARQMAAGEVNPLDAAADYDFQPDIILSEGDPISAAGVTLRTSLTPGHTENHASFIFDEGNSVFCGDHVMAWSTSIVAPPDGSMGKYMSSLDKLSAHRDAVFLSGHGPEITEAGAYIDSLKQHRLARERAVLNALRDGPMTIAALVNKNYAGLADHLRPAAGLSVQAQVEYLIEQKLVQAAPDSPELFKLAP